MYFYVLKHKVKSVLTYFSLLKSQPSVLIFCGISDLYYIMLCMFTDRKDK